MITHHCYTTTILSLLIIIPEIHKV